MTCSLGAEGGEGWGLGLQGISDVLKVAKLWGGGGRVVDNAPVTMSKPCPFSFAEN